MTHQTRKVKRLSILAQHIRLLGEAKGITSTKALAAEIDVTERAIWKAKAELRAHDTLNAGSAENVDSTLNEGSVQAERSFSPPLSACSAEQKEIPPTPPKEKYIPRTTVENPSSVAAREVRCDASTKGTSTSIDWRAVSDRCLEALGAAGDPLAVGLIAVNEPLGWISAGADLDLDVLPTIRRVAAQVAAKGSRIGSWAYFAKPVAEAKARRLAGLPAVNVIPMPARESIQDVLARRKARKAAEAAAAMEAAHG